MAKEIPFKTKPMIQNIVACGRFSKEIDIREANSLEELDAVYKEITRILKQHHFL
ncbi:MAG: hypothetical protein NTV88_04145 [Candidatus Micrarchaeota archaeon]|nr:hypothetical protein [Candidatus Micrarchaeota archaeon]